MKGSGSNNGSTSTVALSVLLGGDERFADPSYQLRAKELVDVSSEIHSALTTLRRQRNGGCHIADPHLESAMEHVSKIKQLARQLLQQDETWHP